MITTQLNKLQYSGNGTTTSFSFPYLFLDNSHLEVTLTDSDGTDTLQVITTNYSVTGAEDPAGGTVTMVTAPASGETLTIRRIVPITQIVDYIANDNFPAETHETALDRLTMICQQLAEIVGRCLKYPETEPASSEDELGSAEARANNVIAFDGNGDLSLTNLPALIASISPTSGSAFSMSVPTGSATSKSVTLTIAGSSNQHKVRVWLIDGSHSSPTLVETADPPDGSTLTGWDIITQTSGSDQVATVVITHNGSSDTWRLCAETDGVVIMSGQITLGV